MSHLPINWLAYAICLINFEAFDGKTAQFSKNGKHSVILTRNTQTQETGTIILCAKCGPVPRTVVVSKHEY